MHGLSGIKRFLCLCRGQQCSDAPQASLTLTRLLVEVQHPLQVGLPQALAGVLHMMIQHRGLSMVTQHRGLAKGSEGWTHRAQRCGPCSATPAQPHRAPAAQIDTEHPVFLAEL